MITQTAEIDEATRPSGLDMALESSTSFPGQQPSPPLRVFISYKEKDRAATLDIKRVLLKIGGGNIRVFVSGDEPAGIQWREGVLNELRNAHILIFLYTDPEARWDWCLYETGYFDAKQNPAELDRRLYVLHGCEVPPSGPFLGLNTVPIDTSAKPDDTRLKHFLGILFERSTNPAVNPYWDEGGCADLVTALAAPFRGRKALAPPEEYVRRLTFRLTKEAATEAALNEGRIPADAMVSGNKKSFELFGLRAAKTGRIWKSRGKKSYRLPTAAQAPTQWRCGSKALLRKCWRRSTKKISTTASRCSSTSSPRRERRRCFDEGGVTLS